ncbi:hypothetical protein LTR10_019522 [Elasticomyces elasticus]|uniref:Dipeptidase n=1 Tax=Exophiala sideris TaxID=1016849 RepID=A0ABR0J6P2_9EURO|nr:hypothetical protein LTR10_019522 [Elasticomyces elasticus]KAK5028487.1 hypothetical protein LTS07_006578 [Exophiala sideris]KAK5035871.1 hypothetical protein LTR13_005441 [Exophiala sideris]KAK5056907.1 hypothetical protein LTR69_007545 [Exophiala sideris]KAK5181314.1 hypothetical protein LTR44_006109 [Eurotiomycetes sp. CCFEE 6388]
MGDTVAAASPRTPAALQDPDESGENRQVVLAGGGPRSRSHYGFITRAFGTVGAVALGLWLAYGSAFGRNIDPLDFQGRNERLLATTPLIDGHNDLPYLLRLELKNKIYDDSKFTFRESLASHTDLRRMKQGKVGGQFWSVFVECPDIVHLDDPNHAVRDTFEQIDVAKRMISHYDELHYCETSSCVPAAFKAGKVPSMLGAEGLHQAGSSIVLIRQLFDAGVRYITVTHNCDNAFATAASTVTQTGRDGGLSEFGAAAVVEMNRLGMMIDLSHTSHKSMRQVLDITRSPVIFSHSACYALSANYRNAPDDNPDAADVETAVDHIMHVVAVAGWDHVGIGADFDGAVDLASGISSVADYPKLIEAVMRRGATDEQVRMLVGENILRVWRENEVNAHVFRKELPVEDVWEGRRWTRWDNGLPIMIPGNPERITAKNHP